MQSLIFLPAFLFYWCIAAIFNAYIIRNDELNGRKAKKEDRAGIFFLFVVFAPVIFPITALVSLYDWMFPD